MPTSFRDLSLLPSIERAVLEQGYDTPTDIQARAIPPLLEGRDLLGIAQTGTGKTASFALPILDSLASEPQPRRKASPAVLVLAPTRELAAQIAASFEAYGRHVDVKTIAIFGGVGMKPQVDALVRGIDILVATPGRLIDLMDQRHVDLGHVEVLVLDEADRMLDMGFLPAVRRVLKSLPTDRQSLLFSATMPQDIATLSRSILRDPVRVEVTPQATTAERIEQSVYFVDKDKKRDLLAEVLRDATIERALVFTRTKRGADRVAKHLQRIGMPAEAIHGDKSQGARERALEGFRAGKVRILVATDIAARGIDVRGITHVFNYELPNVPESYVHRIGRTARAGRDGTAISFCDAEERDLLRAIEKETRQSLRVAGGQDKAPPRVEPSAKAPKDAAASTTAAKPAAKRSRGRAKGRRSRGARISTGAV